MVRLEWLFLVQLVMGALMIVFLQKINQMQKQIDSITKEVTNYILYVTEDMNEGLPKNTESQKMKKIDQDEAQNRLIQAVLGDYFP